MATGSGWKKDVATVAALIIFLAVITGFVLLAFLLDRLFNLPVLKGWVVIAVAVILLISGVLIAGWTIIQFLKNQGTPVPLSPPRKLITYGLYDYVRNPMALGMFLILEGIGFFYGSLLQIIVFAPLPVLLYMFFIKAIEEKELEMRFGEEYIKYKKEVPMIVPVLWKRRSR